MKRNLLIAIASFFVLNESHSIIIIPIPNLAFPSGLSKIRDALEKSTDTKALATVGEDKLFGGRYWVWGQAAGKMTQSDADEQAMRRCEASLSNAKNQTAGGQSLYDFGSKRCELYKFINTTLNLPDPVAQPAPSQAPLVPAAEARTSSTNSIPTPAPQAAPPAVDSAPVLTPNPQPTPQKPNADIVQRMRDLDTLYKQNLITQEEYERKKKQLLESM
jgi:hypothetical protein